ncbi:MAG TPA: SRPBCC domain-containing protein [Anaerolineales bacterium]|nr:SRPBCC domain-containing protein [Anaerolineales bacterium]
MPPDKQTLHMERIFDAPRQVVFDYFTVPELICTWWGPQSVTTEKAEIDLQPGGSCRWEMRDAENKLLLLHGRVVEVFPPERLVMTHQWDGDDQMTTLTLEFIAMGKQTRLLLKQEGISKAIPIHLYDDWWTGTLARLQTVMH